MRTMLSKHSYALLALIGLGLLSLEGWADDVLAEHDLVSEVCQTCANKAHSPQRAARYFQRAVSAVSCQEQYKWVSIALRFDSAHQGAKELRDMAEQSMTIQKTAMQKMAVRKRAMQTAITKANTTQTTTQQHSTQRWGCEYE